jgi:hypothetical protein
MSEDLATWMLEQIAETERVAGALPADGYPKHESRVLSVEGTMDVPWPDRWNPGSGAGRVQRQAADLIGHRRSP